MWRTIFERENMNLYHRKCKNCETTIDLSKDKYGFKRYTGILKLIFYGLEEKIICQECDRDLKLKNILN
jgi:hypothetical protein